MSHTVQGGEPERPFQWTRKASWLTEEQFVRLRQENPDMRLELTAQGELVIMPPTGSETGWLDSEINSALNVWSKKDGAGLTFGSSTSKRRCKSTWTTGRSSAG